MLDKSLDSWDQHTIWIEGKADIAESSVKKTGRGEIEWKLSLSSMIKQIKYFETNAYVDRFYLFIGQDWIRVRQATFGAK